VNKRDYLIYICLYSLLRIVLFIDCVNSLHVQFGFAGQFSYYNLLNEHDSLNLSLNMCDIIMCVPSETVLYRMNLNSLPSTGEGASRGEVSCRTFGLSWDLP